MGHRWDMWGDDAAARRRRSRAICARGLETHAGTRVANPDRMRKTLLLIIGIALLTGGLLCSLSPEPASAHAPWGEAEIGHCDGARDTLLAPAPGIEAVALPQAWGGLGLPSSSRATLSPGRSVELTASPRTIPLRR